jgi:TetR/AcrR family transcriptional repressor of nem operon
MHQSPTIGPGSKSQATLLPIAGQRDVPRTDFGAIVDQSSSYMFAALCRQSKHSLDTFVPAGLRRPSRGRGPVQTAAVTAIFRTVEVQVKASVKRDGGKKEDLLRIGVAVFTEKGFHNTPIDELVAAAGVPKGSFTYYFGSKDAYTLAVIESYGRYFNKKLDRVLGNTSMRPIDRIRAFTDEATTGMERFEFRRGCLVGNLGQELGALDEKFRLALLAALTGWQQRIAACIEEARHAGEIARTADAAGLGRLFWYAWEGAVLGAKLERSRAPLDAISDAFIAHLRSLAPVAKSRTASRPPRARASADAGPKRRP